MYVDAVYDKSKEEICVVERVNGERIYRYFPAIHRAYYENPNGEFVSIFGNKLSKYETNDSLTFRKVLNSKLSGKKIFESDINVVFRCLEENYLGADSPELNVCFFDIETDFNPELGFADPWKPFNAITAISLYLTQLSTMITLVLKPKKKRADGTEYVDLETAEKIVSKFENTYLFEDEKDLLKTFIQLIQDTDVLSGWNSKLFDIPYTVNRVKEVLGKKYIRNFCLWNKEPMVKTITRFEKEMKIYDLFGITHLDYFDLYLKHNTQQRHSYRLDFIGEIEVGENKVPYEGTFDTLYNEEFEKFIEYNRQDVNILVKLDEKKKYIDLANQIAHANCVLLKTTTGSVALIDQAITLEAHSKNLIVPNSKRDIYSSGDDEASDQISDLFDDDEEDDPKDKAAVGAYVADPKKGIHDYIGCVDLSSLYPSTIRSLNISPETLFGQIRMIETNKFISDRIKNKGYKKNEVWEGVFSTLEYDIIMNQTDDELILDLESGETLTITGKDLYEFIYESDNDLVLSANGTIFTKSHDGIIPSLLSRWYSERKQMQKNAKHFGKLTDGVEITDNDLLDELKEIL